MNRFCRAATIASLLVSSTGAHAQVNDSQATTTTITLGQALQYALDHYPTVRAALELVNASTANVSVAKTAYLPRLDALWQTNRATANNIFGLLLPQSVVPAISGPVLLSASSETVWGSAAGGLFSWEPFDFGLRGATVHEAEAGVVRARAEESLTRLAVQNAVGVAFLGVISAQRAVVAAEADVERREILSRAAQTLADNQLRPGAEASRAGAERAAAQTRAIQARQVLVMGQTTLSQVLGIVIGEGAEATAPLGRSVIGGLAAATIATLIVLPSVYALVQQSARSVSPSLDPDDPDSAFRTQLS